MNRIVPSAAARNQTSTHRYSLGIDVQRPREVEDQLMSFQKTGQRLSTCSAEMAERNRIVLLSCSFGHQSNVCALPELGYQYSWLVMPAGESKLDCSSCSGMEKSGHVAAKPMLGRPDRLYGE